MACYMVFMDSYQSDMPNVGGFIARMSSRSSSSKKRSSTTSYSLSDAAELKLKSDFNEQVTKALNKVFSDKPGSFKILTKNLNLRGTFVSNGNTYISTFLPMNIVMSREEIGKYYNWTTRKVTEDDSKNSPLVELENINIDIVALDAKEKEKQEHFAKLLPTVIDEIFKKIGMTSVLKRETTFKTTEDLFSKISGIVKMNENDYYEVKFYSTKDKVDINDFKDMNRWSIKLDVIESRRQNPKLFENNKNVNFSDYKTTLSTLSSYSPTKLFK